VAHRDNLDVLAERKYLLDIKFRILDGLKVACSCNNDCSTSAYCQTHKYVLRAKRENFHVKVKVDKESRFDFTKYNGSKNILN